MHKVSRERLGSLERVVRTSRGSPTNSPLARCYSTSSETKSDVEHTDSEGKIGKFRFTWFTIGFATMTTLRGVAPPLILYRSFF